MLTKDACVAEAGVHGAWQNGHNVDVGGGCSRVPGNPLLLQGHQRPLGDAVGQIAGRPELAFHRGRDQDARIPCCTNM